MNQTAYRKNIRLAEAFGILSIGSLGTLTLAWVLVLCRHGFDFTDESFYLLWISSPWHIRPTQFGYVYHPIWLWVDQDLVLFRQVNILATFGLCMAVGWQITSRLIHSFANPQLGRCYAIAMTAGIAATGISYFTLFTPNYNSLAYQALLITSWGILLADHHYRPGSLFGWSMIACGGYFAFMAKPTTALTLGIIVMVYLILSGRFNFVLLLLAILACVIGLLAFSFAVDRSPVLFVQRMYQATVDLYVVDAGHILWRKISIYLPVYVIIMLCGVLAMYLAMALMIRNAGARTILTPIWHRKADRGISHLFKLTGRIRWLTLCICLLILLGTLGFVTAVRAGIQIYHISLLAAPIAAAGVIFMHRRAGERIRVTWREGCEYAALCCMPLIYAFGTNNGYWWQMQHVSFFWVAGALILLCRLNNIRSRRYACLLLVMMSLVISIHHLNLRAHRAYRQPEPLMRQQTPVQIVPGRPPVFLSKEYAQYIHTLRDKAARAGYRRGDPVLDLTGHWRGALFTMGAMPIGHGSLSGGYPGSQKRAIRCLDRIDLNQIRNAWVLTEPQGHRKLSPKILERYGRNLEQDYRHVATIETPQRSESRGRVQYLYRPEHLTPDR